MDRTVTTRINPDLCTGCGMCVEVCPSDTISMVDGRAQVTGTESLNCGHCAAVCPVEAITVVSLPEEALRFSSFKSPEDWLPPGSFPVDGLVRLMRSRRSCRNYSKEPVDRKILDDLVKAGITAPSGTNSQLWTFTILPTPAAVRKLGMKTSDFFKKLNKMAEKPAARLISKVFMKDVLGQYYRDYYRKVKDKIKEFEETGRDPLFHGAPALIVIAMRPGASCPAEDALLAAQNILLAAHAMGYGTCLIGFAVEAMRNDPAIKRLIGIPDEERVYAVITVGKSNDDYQRVTGRKKVVPRYYEG